MVEAEARGRRRGQLRFWAMFVVAVLALSRLFAATRALRAGVSVGWVAHGIAATGVLGGALLALGFSLYEADRAAGRVRRPVRMYERWLARGDRGPA